MLIAIVLAAGKGTRMRSGLPKVAHRVGGRPMIAHVHTTVTSLGDVAPIYVLGHQHEIVRQLLPDDATVVLQGEQRGTGHAVMAAMPAVPEGAEQVLVLYGDMPLITGATLSSLRVRHAAAGAKLTVLSAEVSLPHGYGRIVRDPDGAPRAIVEEKELRPEQRTITEINTGVYAIDAPWLRGALDRLPRHGDGEYYLTDLVELAAAESALEVLRSDAPDEVVGINDRQGLALAERILRDRTNNALMDAGVTIVDPLHTYIAGDATIGMDTVVEPNVQIGEGVTIGAGCFIGANSRIVASSIGDRCRVIQSVIEYAQLDDEVTVGPFSHLRVGASLGPGVHVGNFAEIKNSEIGGDTRIGHFSYLGDATVGAGVNIGAGTVTANYDGRAKHRTAIGDGAFVGSGTMLRAPVTLGAGSATGAGSVVTHDVEPGTTVAGVPARPHARP